MARIIVLLVGLLAQVLGIDAAQSEWGELGVATLFVWGSVELLKTSVFKELDGFKVNLLAGGVGVVIGVAFGLGEIITGSAFDWVVFGIQATFFATVADLFAKKAGGKAAGAPQLEP